MPSARVLQSWWQKIGRQADPKSVVRKGEFSVGVSTGAITDPKSVVRPGEYEIAKSTGTITKRKKKKKGLFGIKKTKRVREIENSYSKFMSGTME